MSKKNIFIILCVVAFLGSFGISYLLFSKSPLAKISSPLPPTAPSGQIAFDESLPKTEPCPLNGAKYSKQQRDWWEKNNRPLGIMVENHQEARPQSGINSADIVYEAVAEGGITRFLAIYYCQNYVQVGPVRSARTYFLDWISEYGDSPLYVHVGGANTPGPANALGQIEDYGWGAYNDMNQFSIGFPTFWRDYNRLGRPVATEHTMYSTTDKLWKVAKERGLSAKSKDGTPWDEGFVPYEFKEDSPTASSSSIRIEFWGDKEYNVDWKYDPATNTYLRSHAGSPHTDKNSGKQISAKNVVVLSMIESSAFDGYEGNAHLLYRNEGSGKASIFLDGKRINGTWSKDSRTDKTIITDAAGNEIKFNRGKIWFEIVPLDGVVNVK